MGRRQRAYLRSKGLSTDTPKPPLPRYPDSPRPFHRYGAHVAEAWKAGRVLEWDQPRKFASYLAPLIGALTFFGIGYGRWWNERH